MMIDKLQQLTRGIISLLVVAVLAACAGGSGESTSNQPAGPGGGALVPPASNVTYNGPDAADQDVRDFKFFFWDEVVEELIGCADCHMQDGQGSVKFARNDDINLAYAEALTVVDLNDPAASAVVTRVFNGHNCWNSADPTICRDTLIDFITNWANGVAATSATEITFTAPADQKPSGAVVFPDTLSAFDDLYATLTTHCAGCHSDTAPQALQQTPLFAHSDQATAYEAAKTKIDVANPSESRFVVRLRDEAHNCWSGDCAADAAQLLADINTLLPSSPDPVDPALVTSLALTMNGDGIQASSGGRVETHVIAQYEFRLGSGNVVADRSTVAPLMPLTLIGDYEWLDNWGVQFRGGRAQASVTESRKLYDELTATGEYSIEAWVFPANVTQDNTARIIGYSGGITSRNFTLGQSLYNYDFLNRSSTTDGDGRPMLSTANADEDAQANLQHVVLTYDAENGRQIYVNGQHTGDVDPDGGGNLNNWSSDFAFVLGSEVGGSNDWEGAIRFIAIHSRALEPADILTNYDVGVGQKYYLLFRLAALVDHDANPATADQLQELTATPNSYIIFEVSQYDNYSYLFTNPFYLVLGGGAPLAPLDLQGMRVGVNGKVTAVGQAYTQLDMQVTAGGYDPETGHPINPQGMLVPVENGADFDQFFLSFEQLGAHSNVFVEASFNDPVFVGSGDAISDVAVRNFSELRESFAQITGVSSTNAAVSNTYDAVVQQLPSAENISGYLSSHQMGVTQLAISYCDQLIETPVLRTALFPLLDLNADANAMSDSDWENQFMYPMIDRALNTNLSVQPDRDTIRDELHTLLTSLADIKPVDTNGDSNDDPEGDGLPDGIARCGGACPAGTTATAAKAGCAAVLGSATVLLQ